MGQKVRVFKLASEFGMDNETMVAKVQSFGFAVRNYMSALNADDAQRVRRLIKKEQEQDTVEEKIRPTVVRRRSKSGSTKPIRKRPPKIVGEDTQGDVLSETAPKKVEPKPKAARKVTKVASKKEAVLLKPKKVEPPKVEPPVISSHEDEKPVLEDVPIPKEFIEPEPQVVAPPVVKEAVKAVSETSAKAEPVKKTSVEPEVVDGKEVAPLKIPAAEEAASVPMAVEPSVSKPSTSVADNSQAAATVEPQTVSKDAEIEPVASKLKVQDEGQPKVSAEDSMPIKTASAPNPVEPTAGVEVKTTSEDNAVAVMEKPSEIRPSHEAPIIRRRIEVGGTTADAASAKKGKRAKKRKRQVEGDQIAPANKRGRTPKGAFTTVPGRKRRAAPGKKGQKTELTTPKAIKRVVRIEETISLQDLARKMGVKSTELLMKLIALGMSGININSTLDVDTSKILADEFGYSVENIAVAEEDLLADTRSSESDEEKKNRSIRPPVVTMMGHVDHGKTSLLDYIREAKVADGEAGGITQHIGAYRVKTDDGSHIAFIDTPGHAAFTAMRARGADCTDIVVLVTAADDGVMPQTIEAIDHAKAADCPIIVAINKCDLPNADPDRTRRMLMEQSMVPEELGGDVIMVEVSAKTGAGVDKLLEMIALQAEVMELDANPSRPGIGVVLEAYLDKGRGPVANVVVQDGTLKPGDIIVAGNAFGKVRMITDEHGRRVTEAGPSTPVEVLGLSAVPGAGDSFDAVTNMRLAEKVAKSREDKNKKNVAAASRPSLEALYQQMQGDEPADLKLIIKSDVQGTGEALRGALIKLSGEKVKVSVLHTLVGGITESDVLLASTSGAIIIGFNVRPAGKAKRLAEEQGVEIKVFSIVYDVLESVEAAMKGLLQPTIEEEALGTAEIRDTFTIPKIGTIAGSYVTEGKIMRNAKARLIRDSVQIWQGGLSSLRRFKDDVREVQNGFECGIGLDGYNDVKVGDVVEFYVEKEVETTLS